MKDKKNADELIIYHQSIRMGLIIIPLSLGSFSQPTIIWLIHKVRGGRALQSRLLLYG
jgi:hypothetical protein